MIFGELYRIYWEKTEQDLARILRVFGNQPLIRLPASIDGYPVAELGDHCFARTPPLLADTYLTALIRQDTPITDTKEPLAELCGSYINNIILPDTLVQIGDLAFYDCRGLERLEFSSQLVLIGSDAFMNCHRLQHLTLRCRADEKTGLRRILAQIPWDVEVTFRSKNPSDGKNKNDSSVEAAFFFPEYYEQYDEIAPAHIFGRKIQGEGFRARQCFHDSIMDPAQYDNIFLKACAEESEQTLLHLALCRLRYPMGLSEERKITYQAYVHEHETTLCQWLAKEKKLDVLSDLLQNDLLSLDGSRSMIQLAADAGWAEGTALLLHQASANKTVPVRERYCFESFS